MLARFLRMSLLLAASLVARLSRLAASRSRPLLTCSNSCDSMYDSLVTAHQVLADPLYHRPLARPAPRVGGAVTGAARQQLETRPEEEQE